MTCPSNFVLQGHDGEVTEGTGVVHLFGAVEDERGPTGDVAAIRRFTGDAADFGRLGAPSYARDNTRLQRLTVENGEPATPKNVGQFE